MTEISMFILH